MTRRPRRKPTNAERGDPVLRRRDNGYVGDSGGDGAINLRPPRGNKVGRNRPNRRSASRGGCGGRIWHVQAGSEQRGCKRRDCYDFRRTAKGYDIATAATKTADAAKAGLQAEADTDLRTVDIIGVAGSTTRALEERSTSQA
jgi:hypothetical protein